MHLAHELAAREGEARRPKGGGHGRARRRGEQPRAEAQHTVGVEGGVGGARAEQREALLGRDARRRGRALVRQRVGGEDCLGRAAPSEHRHEPLVPAWHEAAVRVDLQVELLAVIELTLHKVPRPHGPARLPPWHPHAAHLLPPLGTKQGEVDTGLVAVLAFVPALGPGPGPTAASTLEADAHHKPLRPRRLSEEREQRVRTLGVAVACHRDEDASRRARSRARTHRRPICRLWRASEARARS
eukprot:scaffold28117_cov64-Phaeocystis_antarctica.AAC.7